MKLPSGKRLGQSEYELALAVFFSFFLHAALVFAALFLYFWGGPKTVLAPVYQVKLVGRPDEPAPAAPASAAAPEPPRQDAAPKPVKPLPRLKKAAAKLEKAAPKKGALPELGNRKQKPAQLEQTKAAEAAPKAPPAAPSVPAVGAATAGKKSEGVDVKQPQDFKYSWYLVNVIERIRQHWSPPPDSKDARARVLFKVNRSGWVIAVHLDDEYSNGSFQFKQAAVRAINLSNPFPSLPDEYFKQSLEFTVDLVPEE